MATMNTSHRYMFDAAPATLFRGRNLPALVTDFYESPVTALDQVLGYWNEDGELADETFAVIINVTMLTGELNLGVSFHDAAGDSIPAAGLGGSMVTTATGQFVFLFDAPTLRLIAPNAVGVSVFGYSSVDFDPFNCHAWMS